MTDQGSGEPGFREEEDRRRTEIHRKTEQGDELTEEHSLAGKQGAERAYARARQPAQKQEGRADSTVDERLTEIGPPPARGGSGEQAQED